MATASTNTVIDHSSDAGFRAWVAEFITLFTTGGAGEGLVQLADGAGAGQGGTQINTATVTRAAVNTNAGHAVFAFDDALQSTAPYFVRIDFGTDNIATEPRIQVTLGTGVTGGVISGTLLAATSIGQTTSIPTSSSTPYPSYACGHAGTVGLAFKIGAAAAGGYLYIGLHRVRDLAGDQTTDGLIFVYPQFNANVTASMRSYRRVNPASFGGDGANSFSSVPLLTTSSIAPGGAALCYRHFTALPEPRPMLESVTVIATEVAVGSTFPARPVGLVDRTYICCGGVMSGVAAGALAGSTTYSIAMLYD